ncbi:hypothetical protein ACQEU5_05345 [Marinactinospora thermotolerans]|uniref:hypothetical protein n=1 Tax=Marinactinospora thermotolerans TaxID=531310 RepID=UPI003D8B6243
MLRLFVRPVRNDRGEAVTLTVVGVIVVFVLLLTLVLMLSLVAGGRGSGAAAGCAPRSSQPGLSGDAENGIPEDYLEAYRQIGREHNIPWNVLAGVGKQESDHGRNPSSGVSSGTNDAGAAGPMQHGVLNDGAAANAWSKPVRGDRRLDVDDLSGASFWDDPSRRHGDGSGWPGYFAADGNDDGFVDVYDIWDAATGTAGYLLWMGFEENPEAALQSYHDGPGNSPGWYSDSVMRWAESYADGEFEVVDGSGAQNCALPGPPGDVDVEKMKDGELEECTVPGLFGKQGGVQMLTPLTCAAHAVIYAEFEDVVHNVHAQRCPDDGYEHPRGRAVDYMINGGGVVATGQDERNGDDLAAWVQRHAADLGVYYIIWKQRIWYAATPGSGWSGMSDRGGATANHYDHVHVSFIGSNQTTCNDGINVGRT